MSGPAYYNEADPFAAAWLRELMKAWDACAVTAMPSSRRLPRSLSKRI